MKLLHLQRRRVIAFTLVELLVVLAIIALMGSLSAPGIGMMIRHAQSMKCATNLRSIGAAAMLAASDNNNQYPEIDQAASPVYPAGSGVQGLVGTLGAYGITTNSVQCPTDLGSTPNSFTAYGSSYEWNPVFDDEVVTTPILYLNANVKIPVNSSRVRLCTDFLSIHNGRMNAVYGDGHVKYR